MRLMLAALVATFAIAVTAAVFAIWPVVATAPWEDDFGISSEAICADALELKEKALRFLADADNSYDREMYGNWVNVAVHVSARHC